MARAGLKANISRKPMSEPSVTAVHCTNCGRPYPDRGAPFRCSKCGGLYDFVEFPAFDVNLIEDSQPGIWRYRHALGLPPEAQLVTLGEGRTPLIWAEAHQRQVAFKLEFLNPTGSFKDRGSATLVSFLVSRKVKSAVEDSSGNAGASFAAYAARGGLQARVFVPESASGPKRSQIEAYGAQITTVPGPRSEAALAVIRAAKKGVAYASHAYLPFNLPGYATIAYEIYQQLGQAPGSLVAPSGQGGLLLGASRGFMALNKAGLIQNLPRLVGVQAHACAPLWAVSNYGANGMSWVSEAPSLAEGVRVRYPLRGDAVLRAVEESGGRFLAVEENEILPGRDELARRGFYVEPTSALVWSALGQSLDEMPPPVVVILTGSGLKYSGN
jgi:threonine synthase